MGHHVYALPDGGRLNLSAKRQAKKVIMAKENLSPRAYRREKKRLQREKAAAERKRRATGVQ